MNDTLDIPVIPESVATDAIASFDTYTGRRAYMGDVKLEQATLNTSPNNNLTMPYLDSRPAFKDAPVLQSFSNTLQAGGGKASRADVDWVTQLRLDLREDAKANRLTLKSPEASLEAKVEAVQSLKADKRQFAQLQTSAFAP